MASSRVIDDTTSDDSEEFVFVTYSEGRLLKILQRLWAMKKSKKVYCKISEDECVTIAYQASLEFAKQDTLIDVKPPVTVCGDTHGQFRDVLRVLEAGGIPPETSYLFLGDYVDRGKNSIEVILTLFIYKILHPDVMFMVRGNHEEALTNSRYGFLDECTQRCNFGVYAAFNDCFNYMPVAAIIGQRIFCCHGGIVKDLDSISVIAEISRPLKRPIECPIASQLTWNDPNRKADGWKESPRGAGFVFGKTPLRKFLEEFNLDFLARAHQVALDGYEFFAERRCVTIFSAPNYCDKYDNAAGMMKVARDLTCSFVIVLPGGRFSKTVVKHHKQSGEDKPREVTEKFDISRPPNPASVPDPPTGKSRQIEEDELRELIEDSRRPQIPIPPPVSNTPKREKAKKEKEKKKKKKRSWKRCWLS